MTLRPSLDPFFAVKEPTFTCPTQCAVVSYFAAQVFHMSTFHPVRIRAELLTSSSV